MKYVIVGAGAIGGCVGGFLSKAGKDVTLIARGEHLTAMQTKGLELRNTPKDIWIQPIKARSEMQYQDQADVVFVTVKAYSLESVVPFIQRISHANTLIIPLLNVSGTGDQLAAQLPGLQVLDGVIYVSARVTSPGVLTMGGGSSFRMVIGERIGNGNQQRLEQIKADLEESGIQVVISGNIKRDTFRKFAFISPFAATGAYYDVAIGEIQSNPTIRTMFLACCEELAAIAKAEKIEFETDLLREITKRLDQSVPQLKASMQSDLERGGDSELDGLVFAVVRKGRILGVPTPTYEKIAEKFA